MQERLARLSEITNSTRVLVERDTDTESVDTAAHAWLSAYGVMRAAKGTLSNEQLGAMVREYLEQIEREAAVEALAREVHRDGER